MNPSILLLLAGAAGVAVVATTSGKKKRSGVYPSPGPFADSACKTWKSLQAQTKWAADVLQPVLEREVDYSARSEWLALESGLGDGSIYAGTLSLTAVILAKAGVSQCSPWTGSTEKRFLFKSVWCAVLQRLVQTEKIPTVGGSSVEETVQMIRDACARADFDPQDPADVEGLDR